MKNLSITILCLSLLSCAESPDSKSKSVNTDDDQFTDVRAQELAKKFIIVDGHVDLPYKLAEEGWMKKGQLPDLRKEFDGNFDYAKSKRGGFDAPFMSIFLPAKLQTVGGASKALADSLIDMVGSIAERYPDHFALANSPGEVKANFEKGLVSLPMGMENGSGLEDDLDNVQYFFERGIRYITLSHGKANRICDSSYDKERMWNGLSPFGKEVVAEMNRVGIMVDISHVSDSTFYQVMKLSSVPCIASHSSARKFTPGFERNMSDDMIKLLASKGGVMMINFGSTFVSDRSRKIWDEFKSMRDQLKSDSSHLSKNELEKLNNEWLEDHNLFASVSEVADHIDHVVQLVGIDYVGFGSDFDGVGNTLPNGLKTAADYPKLIAELLERGYTEEDIQKISHKNIFRVWNQVLVHASNS